MTIARNPLALAGAAAGAAAAFSLLLPSSPGYDPLAWLVWGREVASLDLDTSSGPAWKPLPVLVTTLLAPAGEAAESLWLVVARAGGLLAAVFAARLAYRLAPPRARVVAGIAAGVGLLLVEDFVRGVAVGNSEGLLIALLLLAVDRHLDSRRGQALALLVAAALLRPEVWPLLGGYAALVWSRERGRRPLVAASLVAVAALWFLPELWGSGDLLRSSERARIANPGAPALAERPALEVTKRFAAMTPLPLVLAALGATVFAARRRTRTTLVLGGFAVAWLALVAVMSEAGYAGEERYLLPAAAVVCVLGGLATAHVVAAPPGRAGRALARAASTAVLAALLAASAPGLRALGHDLAYAADLHHDLERAVAEAGGPTRIRRCGPVYAGRYRFPALAWRLRIHIADVAMRPAAPGVVFRSRLTRRSLPAPGLPVRGSPFVRIARAGSWEIYASCPSVAAL